MSRSMKIGAISLAVVILLAYLLMPTLKPFLIAALLAYLSNPLVQRLQRWHLPRTLAVTLVFALTFALIALMVGFIVPLVEAQILELLTNLPKAVAFIQTVAVPKLGQIAGHYDLTPSLQIDPLTSVLSQHWQQTGRYIWSVWQHVSHSSLALFAWVVDLLLIPVVTFYLMRDWPRLMAQVADLLPRKAAPKIIQIGQECEAVLGAFFRGQLMVMMALAVVYSLGLSLTGLSLSLLIGLSAGILSIVPYLGFSIGLISALLAALVQFPDHLHLLYVLIVFVIGNALEGMVLTPWLVGDKIGLHPVAVIFALLAGGQLFGFIGILLALPVASVLMVWLRHLHHYYVQGSWYQR